MSMFVYLWLWQAALSEASYDSVVKDSYHVQGYNCTNSKTMIWYPKGEGPYPIVVFLHGSDGTSEINSYEDGLEDVAHFGLVVVAPYTTGDDCSSSGEWKDARTALLASQNSSLSPGLAKVDWARVGIWGHSMGGRTAPKAAMKIDNVHALICSHGSRDGYLIQDIPTLYLTGTKDMGESWRNPEHMRNEYNENLATHKVLTDISGGEHMEPMTVGEINPWIGRFLMCHLAESGTDCERIYGKATDSLRKVTNIKFHELWINGSVPSTPPPRRRRVSSPRRRRSSPPPARRRRAASCTPKGHDPQYSGYEAPCCSGLSQVLKDWDDDNHYYYKCEAADNDVQLFA